MQKGPPIVRAFLMRDSNTNNMPPLSMQAAVFLTDFNTRLVRLRRFEYLYAANF